MLENISHKIMYVERFLRQTDEEIIEQDKMIEKEIADGVIPDPNQPVDPETGMPMDPSMAWMIQQLQVVLLEVWEKFQQNQIWNNKQEQQKNIL